MIKVDNIDKCNSFSYETNNTNDNYKKDKKELSTSIIIYYIFHVIMSIVSVYLSWKCNKGEFNLLSFLVALIFPYVYIIYIAATQGSCGLLSYDKA